MESGSTAAARARTAASAAANPAAVTSAASDAMTGPRSGSATTAATSARRATGRGGASPASAATAGGRLTGAIRTWAPVAMRRASAYSAAAAVGTTTYRAPAVRAATVRLPVGPRSRRPAGRLTTSATPWRRSSAARSSTCDPATPPYTPSS
jgi:hypothetical protein